MLVHTVTHQLADANAQTDVQWLDDEQATEGNRKEHIMSKVWFITGAGSGIGAGTVRAALAAGDRVVLTGRNVQKLRNTFRGEANDNLEILQLDVSD